jgi:hypothetical protein
MAARVAARQTNQIAYDKIRLTAPAIGVLPARFVRTSTTTTIGAETAQETEL